MTFTVVLFAVVHLLGCGWFLIATFESDYDATWVGRRGLLDGASAFDQWMNSCYFILTVFTTVGFGDISAASNPEIVYSSFTMLVGAVIQSLIVSEMIGIVRSVDKAAAQRKKKKDLIDSFATHTEISAQDARMILSAIPEEAMKIDYKKEEMRRLIVDGTIPRAQVHKLSQRVFGGDLLLNRFISICNDHRTTLPPRFPLLVALAAQVREYRQGEFAYHSFEHPWSVFIVLYGTMAAVGVPQQTGGIARLLPSATSLLCAAIEAQSDAQGLVTHQNSESSSSTALLSAAMYPYQFFGGGNYFGEAEVIDMVPRATSMRCESAKARVLILPKDEFYRLAEEFPGFAGAWRAASRRREDRRIALLGRLTRGLPYKVRAAMAIQGQVRKWLMERNGDKKTTLAFVSGALSTLTLGRATQELPDEREEAPEAKARLDGAELDFPSVLENHMYEQLVADGSSAGGSGTHHAHQQNVHFIRESDVADSSVLAAAQSLQLEGARSSVGGRERVHGFWTETSVKNTVHQLERETDDLRKEVHHLRLDMREGFAEIKALLMHMRHDDSQILTM